MRQVPESLNKFIFLVHTFQFECKLCSYCVIPLQNVEQGSFKKIKDNRSSFEGAGLICRLWGQLSLQVGKELAIIFGWSKKSS